MSLPEGSIAGLCPAERRGLGGTEPDRRQRRIEEGGRFFEHETKTSGSEV